MLEIFKDVSQKIVQDLEMDKILLSIVSEGSWASLRVFSGAYLIMLRYSSLTEF